ncbi:MAG: OmpA family protein [Thermodesulfobacteria bacterium]|nr:OmpA family protein [Thermodesulfobacteriota bacterium]
MKRSISLLFMAFLLISPSCLFAKGGFSLGDIQRALEEAQKALQKVQQPGQPGQGNEAVSGVITITDTSRPWYFKMDWFDAAASSRIYMQVNNQRPRFLVEFIGPHPPTGAPIRLEGLRAGDKVKFLVKTCWHGKKYGPVDSGNSRFFRVTKKGANLYYFQFEDAVGYDMAYNDGAFYFYQEGFGPAPNRYIWIKKFDVQKAPSGLLLKGTVHVTAPGYVNSHVEIRDNGWRVYKTVGLDFRAQRPGDHDFQYTIRDALPAPMYTAIWQVGFSGETDSRVRPLKGCLDSALPVTVPPSPLGSDKDLLLYYSFDDCSPKDMSGNGLDGMIHGRPSCIGGLQVRSLYFNRVDRNNGCGRPGGDFISMPALGSVFQQGITICAWAKFESPRFYERIVDLGNGPGEQGGYNIIFGRIDTSNNIGIESWINSDGNFNRSVGRLTYPGIVNGEWNHYCATIDNSSRKMRLYINGQLKAEKTGNPVANVPRSSNFIAHSNWCYNDPDFKGAIDELRIFKRALTPNEIRKLYSKQKAIGPATPQTGVFGSTKKNPFIFEGTIYFLPVGTKRLPDFSRLKPVGKIYTPALNITPRSFLEGFPGVTNRFEWFAIDYKGRIYIKKPGTYTFALLSDDGSKLIIDGRTVINNDGIHPPIERRGTVFLGRGLHDIEVQYFQGPREEVALVLYLIEGGRKNLFDIRRFAPVTMVEGRKQDRLTLGAGILFDFNRYSLRPDAIKVLDSVYDLLKNYKYKKIVIEGYTDNIGSDSYNLRLSRNRAQAVANYLIGKGVPRSKIQVIGYGKKRPRFPNDTEEHRALNRRVEIRIIKE